MVISDKKIEIPDECPEDCRFKDDIQLYGQNAMCGRCPIFNCRTDLKNDPEGIYTPMVEAEGFRSDWAKQFKKFFDGDIDYPILYLTFTEDDIQE